MRIDIKAKRVELSAQEFATFRPGPGAGAGGAPWRAEAGRQWHETMRKVAEFSFEHGLLGEGAKDPSAVGMSFANGVTSGDTANLKLRFDPTYVQMAADAKL